MSKRFVPLMKWAAILSIFVASAAYSAPYADIVIDAETGEVLHEYNADMRLHPAGLTKLMTLYVAFDAIENGAIGLDDSVVISRKAQGEPPERLGLRNGQKIKLLHLLRAAGVGGANDAATALAEGIAGSEDEFVRRLNEHSEKLGLAHSSWRNAHGLTISGHLSTARDIATLFAAHKKDFPSFFDLFSRIRSDAGLKVVVNSSQNLLSDIEGIQGANFGFTLAAGFNGAVYVQRQGKRVVAVIFGARSEATLVKRMNEILNEGFAAFD